MIKKIEVHLSWEGELQIEVDILYKLMTTTRARTTIVGTSVFLARTLVAY